MNVDSPEYKKVVEYLRHIGLSTDEISAYLYLLSKGPQTVLALSRGINTGRTKLYPLLDKLAEKQLITSESRHYGTTFQALPAESVEFLVAAMEKSSQIARSDLGGVLQKLETIAAGSPITSNIMEYSGTDEIRQLYWKTTQYDGPKLTAPHKPTRRTLGVAFISKNCLEPATTIQNHPFDHEIHVYGNKVAIFDAKHGVLIKNQLLYANYQTILMMFCK